MKLAIYKSLDKGDGCGSWTAPHKADDWIDKPESGYLRLTEYIEVEFVPLPPEETIGAQLASIDAREDQLTSKYLFAKSKLQDERKDLLALSPPTAVRSGAA